MATIALSPTLPSGPSPSASTSVLPVPVRPKFNSHITSDRLREGAGLRLPAFAVRSSNIQKGRTSVFREMGLENDMAFGDDSYLVAREDVTKKQSDVTTSTTNSHGPVDSRQTFRPWYAKLATRPTVTRQHFDQNRIPIPTVNIIITDPQ